MRCKKCKYITFDYYKSCPKCNTPFDEIKKNLNIPDYILTEESNYLFPEIFEEEKPEEIVVENQRYKEEETEKEEFEFTEEDGISISELLEKTRFEDSNE